MLRTSSIHTLRRLPLLLSRQNSLASHGSPSVTTLVARARSGVLAQRFSSRPNGDDDNDDNPKNNDGQGEDDSVMDSSSSSSSSDTMDVVSANDGTDAPQQQYRKLQKLRRTRSQMYTPGTEPQAVPTPSAGASVAGQDDRSNSNNGEDGNDSTARNILAPEINPSGIRVTAPSTKSTGIEVMRRGVLATGTLPLALPLKVPFPLFPHVKNNIVMEDEASLTMLDRGLRANKARFGIYPLTELEAEAGHAVVNTVGVTAHVIKHKMTDTGGSSLITELRRRFRVIEEPRITQWGYPVAKVEYFDDFEASKEHELDCWDLSGYARYIIETLFRNASENMPYQYRQATAKHWDKVLSSIPDDPKAMSFWLANHIPAGPDVHNQWLRSTSTRARLSEEINLMSKIFTMEQEGSAPPFGGVGGIGGSGGLGGKGGLGGLGGIGGL
eukprot:TRINITY_DN940_c0_g2_i1.p1 TRINITY_DN940_c0_g2~~TRINITY_DN940_c0_g2_i1.p1  ORF type:complete len:441 (-),score=89.47 TRINITY_DN940_c0_g2_i1:34-1356(-)